jgi:hypothetical protein
MIQLERIGKNDVSERHLFVLSLPHISDLPEALNLQSKYFGVLLACNAWGISDVAIVEFARSLVENGMRYFSSWGGDCERVHDLFDSAIINREPHETEDSVIMTMWLKEESLDEALWSFLYVSFPANDYWADCGAELIIIVGNSGWAEQIKTRLSDLDALNKDVVGEEDEGDAETAI